jgi:hypothetical protein
MRIVVALALAAAVSATGAFGQESPKSVKQPYITLTASVCLKSGSGCEDIVLTDSDVADMSLQPIEFDPKTNKVTMWVYIPPSIKECQVHGVHSVLAHLRKNDKDPDRYDVKSWLCQLGNKKPPVEKKI